MAKLMPLQRRTIELTVLLEPKKTRLPELPPASYSRFWKEVGAKLNKVNPLLPRFVIIANPPVSRSQGACQCSNCESC